MTVNDQHTIERYYAYSAARLTIQAYCRLIGYNAAHSLEWDTAQRIDVDEDRIHRDIDRAVAYLDSRNLLLRPHAGLPSIVVIKPNDEERRSAARGNDMSITA